MKKIIFVFLCTILAACESGETNENNNILGRYGGNDCQWGALEFGKNKKVYIETIYKVAGTFEVDGKNVIVKGQGMPEVVFTKNGNILDGGILGKCEKIIDLTEISGTYYIDSERYKNLLTESAKSSSDHDTKYIQAFLSDKSNQNKIDNGKLIINDTTISVDFYLLDNRISIQDVEYIKDIETRKSNVLLSSAGHTSTPNQFLKIIDKDKFVYQIKIPDSPLLSIYFLKNKPKNNAIHATSHEISDEDRISTTLKNQKISSDSATSQKLIDLADEGNPYAQRKLGRSYLDRYLEDTVIIKDDKKGYLWNKKGYESFKSLAESGSPDAQYELGNIYFYGIDDFMVNFDRKKSFKWFLEAAKQGHAYAEYMVATAYDNGRVDEERGYGVKKDIDKAIEWYTKSAKKGVEEAKNMLKNVHSIEVE